MDYEQIRESEDRSWSLKLIDKFKSCNDESELNEIARTLQALDDYRAEKPIQEILEDCNNSPFLRSLASDILSACVTSDTESLRKCWWESGDEILMRHAIRVSTRREKELLSKIAADPEHKFYIDAIESMAFGYEEPCFQELKIRAMSHSDPAVRKAAAETLLWDQPVAAEPGLLVLADDEEDEVAEEALNALCYYSSQAVLRRLSQLKATGRKPLREMQENAFAELRQDFESSIGHLRANNPEAFREFRNWLAPVEDLFDWNEIEKHEHATDYSAPKALKLKVSAAELIEKFSDENGKWAGSRSYCHSIDYEAFSADEKSALERFFSTHIDWSVRELAGLVLAKTGCGNSLMKLLDDTVLRVRKSAAYWIRDLSKSPELAEILWEMVLDEENGGTFGIEALESYVIHESSSNSLEERLVNLALSDLRESIRMTAVCELKKLGARASIKSVLPLLKEAPLVTWTVHASILDACFALKISVPDFARLAEIDDLYVQEALAKVLSLGG